MSWVGIQGCRTAIAQPAISQRFYVLGLVRCSEFCLARKTRQATHEQLLPLNLAEASTATRKGIRTHPYYSEALLLSPHSIFCKMENAFGLYLATAKKHHTAEELSDIAVTFARRYEADLLASTHNKTAPITLFSIPPEIRNRIYEEVFPRNHIIRNDSAGKFYLRQRGGWSADGRQASWNREYAAHPPFYAKKHCPSSIVRICQLASSP